ncbi:MAG: META domain-containing protein [Flavobacteriaceae bacterium]
MKNAPISLVLILLLSSCASSIHKVGQKTIWINSSKTACFEGSPMQCLQVQVSDKIQKDEWQTLFDPIENFDFVPGYFHQIQIEVSKLAPTQLEGNSFSYNYIKTIQQVPDSLHPLNGDWKLYAVEGVPLTADHDQIPSIGIDIPNTQISGVGTCNRINGQIASFNDHELSFGPLMSTRMMCQDMVLEIDLFMNLEKTHHYVLENGQLILLDDNNNQLLIFERVYPV